MNTRIKQLRQSQSLTQEEFGARIGITKSSMSTIESGKSNPSEQTIRLICLAYNVNEDWLRTGAGQMFREPDSFSLDRLVAARGGTELELRIIKAYFDLDPAIRRTVLDHFQAALRDSDNSTPAPTVEQLEEEYKKAVLNGASHTTVSASNTTKDNWTKDA